VEARVQGCMRMGGNYWYSEVSGSLFEFRTGGRED